MAMAGMSPLESNLGQNWEVSSMEVCESREQKVMGAGES